MSIVATEKRDKLPPVLQNFVKALNEVGVPACVTLVESNSDGSSIAAEKSITTQ